jgi:hypothetical protein
MIKNILNKFWKHFFLVCIITSLFTIFSIILYYTMPKKYETSVSLDKNPLLIGIVDPTLIIFKYESSVLSEKLQINLKDSLKKKLYSLTFFKNFITKKGLEKKDISFYVKDMDQYEKSPFNKIYLRYDSNLGISGPALINDYVNFMIDEVKKEYKSQLFKILLNEKGIYKNAYDKAVAINLAYPLGFESVETNLSKDNQEIFLLSNELFSNGYIILQKQIDFIDKELNRLNEDVIDLNIVVDPAVNEKLLYSRNLFICLGFILGFLLSLIIILIRHNITNLIRQK